MTPQELKNSILLLAVTGRIVCQDSADEPAVHLIDAIRNKQNQLLSDGVIKREKFNSEIDLENDLPEGWCYAKLGELTTVVTKQTGFDYSKTIKPNLSEAKLPGMIPMVQTKNFKGKQFVFETDYYIPETIAKEFPKILLDSKCMLLSIVGASIGNIGIYPGQPLAMIGGAICKVTLIDDRLYDYLYYFLQSPLGQQEIKKNLKATAQGTITVQDVREITIKVPPLAEQKRIVAKIEELLPLIERYEKAWSRLEDFNKRFPVDMQKSILQMAIQGKLVEQRPEEGTGEELYKRLKKHHSGLKPGKDELDYSSMDYEIPDSWKMVELNQLFDFVDYRGKTPNKITEGVFLITASNIRQGYMDYTRKEYISLEEYQGRQSRGITQKGDLLFTTEAPMGNAALCDLDVCSCGQRIITFKPYEKETAIPALYMFFILSPPFQSQLLDNCTGTTAKGIKADKLKHFLIPLPPLAEQKRIVARLEELLPLCERLK